MYSLDLLYEEIAKYRAILNKALDSKHIDWDKVVPAERILEDLRKAVDVLEDSKEYY